MIRPFAAMGEVHCRTLTQMSPSAAPLKMTMPESRSTPINLLALMYQTMASLIPSVVVAMGAVGPPADRGFDPGLPSRGPGAGPRSLSLPGQLFPPNDEGPALPDHELDRPPRYPSSPA